MNHCKPCITIRDITKIILNNIKLTYKNIKSDIKSYSRVNATVCELSKPAKKQWYEYELDAIKKEAQRENDKEAHRVILTEIDRVVLNYNRGSSNNQERGSQGNSNRGSQGF